MAALVDYGANSDSDDHSSDEAGEGQNLHLLEGSKSVHDMKKQMQLDSSPAVIAKVRWICFI